MEDLIRLISNGPFDLMVEKMRTAISKPSDFTYRDQYGRNVLHYACERRGNKEAVKFVDRILSKAHSIGISDEDLQSLLNQAEYPRNFITYCKSPIHIALDCENRELVKLLLEAGADVNLPTDGGDNEVIRRIYKEMPEVLVQIFGSHLKCEENELDAAEELRTSWDFTPVTRLLPHYGEEEDCLIFKKLESQTFQLAQALHEGKVTRSIVLCHPLVQLFLHFKEEKFRWPIWISILTSSLLLAPLICL